MNKQHIAYLPVVDRGTKMGFVTIKCHRPTYKNGGWDEDGKGWDIIFIQLIFGGLDFVIN